LEGLLLLGSGDGLQALHGDAEAVQGEGHERGEEDGEGGVCAGLVGRHGYCGFGIWFLVEEFVCLLMDRWFCCLLFGLEGQWRWAG